MKYTIATDDKKEMKLYLAASDLKGVVECFLEHLKSILKHADLDEKERERIDNIEDYLIDALTDIDYF